MTQHRVATIFGGTGFLGHAVVQAFAARGYQVRVPTRNLDKAQALLLLGRIGQIVPFLASVRSDATVAEALRGSDVVVNLIGELSESSKNSFQLAHVETAARMARIAKAEAVAHFIHVSALGADMKSMSRYARTKAIGEEAVRAFFGDAVLLRPSVMFGPRDRFFNKFAQMARFLPFLPLIGGGHTRFQPVYVGDVALSVLACLDHPEARGHVYLLGGPNVYSFQELMQILLRQMGLRRWLVSVPWGLARFKARLFEFFPNPPFTRDQIELLKTDNTVRLQHGGRAPEMESLGVLPTALEDILPSYLMKIN
ncbi:MAG: complex I NDUFA9 subunit family protein [Alphaproteobacteria bacterium]|nr:complex I NDUFA9 subunit family protein [Alphaproteobacteria bacterium]